jgi:hypothetical protein
MVRAEFKEALRELEERMEAGGLASVNERVD